MVLVGLSSWALWNVNSCTLPSTLVGRLVVSFVVLGQSDWTGEGELCSVRRTYKLNIIYTLRPVDDHHHYYIYCWSCPRGNHSRRRSCDDDDEENCSIFCSTGHGGRDGVEQEEALTRFVGALLWIYNTVVSVAWSLSVQVFKFSGRLLWIEVKEEEVEQVGQDKGVFSREAVARHAREWLWKSIKSMKLKTEREIGRTKWFKLKEFRIFLMKIDYCPGQV